MEENNTNNVANQPLNTADTAKTAPSVPAPETSAPQTTTQSSTDALKQKLQEVSKNHLVSFIISALTKPTSTFKEKLSGFSSFKKAWQLPLITTGLLLYFPSSIRLLPKSTLQPTNLSSANR